jgi:hypothetical protein
MWDMGEEGKCTALTGQLKALPLLSTEIELCTLL